MTERTWYNHPAVKAFSALFAILTVWITIICICGSLICFSEGFYSNQMDINESVLQNHTDFNAIAHYYQIVLDTEKSPEAKINLQSVLSHYKSMFSTEHTNLRFVITDSLGNMLLTNDPLYDKNQNILTAFSQSRPLALDSERYEKIVHFDDYDSILQADWLSYLPDNEFNCWFFADDEVDAIRETGFMMEEIYYRDVDTLSFPTLEEATAYDYQSSYGENCQIAISSDADNGQFIVAVQVIDPRSTPIKVSLQEYYKRKKEHQQANDGITVRAVSESLENKIKNGLDVAVVGMAQPTEIINISTYLPRNMLIKDSISEDVSMMRFLYQLRKVVLVCSFVFTTVAIAACIVLCTTAGHVRGKEDIVVTRIHKIGFELFWLLPVLAAVATILILSAALYHQMSWTALAMLAGGLFFADTASCILLLYTIAIRSKSGTFWSSFFVVRIFKKFFFLFNNKVSICLIIALYSFVLFFANVTLPREMQSDVVNFFVILFDIFTLILMFYLVYAYFELKKRVNRMENGNFEPIEPQIPLVLDFYEFSKSLDNMTGGIQSMVEQQTRAERMRTELITNVSHDLKTPLTSIVNYTDLLSREPMQTEHAAEYLEVLKRQSERLKKLTEDLVDASKASSGALTVDLQPIDLQVLISQLACEYEDKLSARGLSLVPSFPPAPVQILADGRHLFRVFSNILGNACKYSMAGSRVYLDVAESGGIVEITMKNISEHALNVTPDELTERFVRGDASRHTEGSGLGLSIAKDLTRLQGGKLSLEIDGDLFKVILRFPKYLQ